MDNILNPVSGTSQPPYATSPRSPGAADSALTAYDSITVQQPAASETTGDSSSTEQQYEAALRQAALSFKNVYALGDQQFSIFKDATGKYITRYVSLRDGRVTYLPEPTLVKQMQMDGGTAPHLAISA